MAGVHDKLSLEGKGEGEGGREDHYPLRSPSWHSNWGGQLDRSAAQRVREARGRPGGCY